MKPKKPFNHQSNLRIFAANKIENPLLEIDPKYQEYVSSDDSANEKLRVNIKCVSSFNKLSDDERNFVTKLTEINMKDHYEQSLNGWNAKQKEKEFKNENARFLICSSSENQNQLVAFVHFRFELDDEQKHPVLYCYEIQVDSKYQSLGLGKYLMEILNELAAKFKMYKIMLTCFVHNSRTLEFYSKLGYNTDICSPSKCNMIADYEILSSRVKNQAS